ncbi:MAG: hypothetical protein ABIB04_04105 [Patescibacteria group bacterium]
MVDLSSSTPERPIPEILPTEESGIEADEKAYDALPESKDVFLEEEDKFGPTTKILEGKKVVSAAAPSPIVPKDDVTIEVEKILEEGLGDVYENLPESAKPKFKEKGELAAREISAMVRSLKLKLRKVLELIRDWLLTVPGVNRFFLEQEAKIKVDKLRELVEDKKEERLKQP